MMSHLAFAIRYLPLTRSVKGSTFAIGLARSLTVAVLIGCWAAPRVQAQSGGGYVIKKNTIDGGGHSNLTGGGYRASGTIGQHDATELNGGGYRMIGGFWSPQTEGPACPMAAAPELAQFDGNFGPPISLVDLKIQRYLAIQAPGSSGRTQAIRIHFRSLPPPWDIWNGTKMFVQEPTTQCEVSGIGPGQTCPAGAATFAFAGLTCDLGQAAFRDWTTVAGGTVYVAHPAIVPKRTVAPAAAAEYEIQMLDSSCEVGAEGNYSPPKQVLQTPWGDIGGPFDGTTPPGYYVASDNNVSVTIDVTACLSKFSNRAGAPIKARADVEPCVPDLKVNISDVTQVLNGFRNVAFPFSPTGGFGCANADPCSYAGS